MDEIYNLAMYDLNKLSEWGMELANKIPHLGLVDDELYLQNTSIHILIISQLEYFLKKKKIIQEREQYKIIEVIENSSLEQLEKDHLIHLFFIRHTLVHNGGHCDSKFLEDVSFHIKKLKLKGFEEGLLSSSDPKFLSMYVELVKKLIKELHGQKSN